MNRLFRCCVIIYLGGIPSLVSSWSSTPTSPHHRGFSVSRLSATVSREDENDIRFNNANSLSNEKIDASSLMLNRRSLLLGSGVAATVGAVSALTRSPAQAATTTTAAATTTAPIPQWTLRGGVKMPVLAINTVGLSADETEHAVSLALQYGITHIDFHPGKERDGVAKYLASNKRSDLFLNTKIRKAPPGTSPKEAADRARNQIAEDLAALNVPNVDMLMLRDSPDAEVIQSQWAVLEDALEKGQTKSIGVVNYCQFSLQSVLQTAKVKPALNYYLNHVGMGLDPKGLRSYGESRGIKTFAYGAVGEPGPNPELLEKFSIGQIAKSHGVSPEAVALRWVLQTGAAASVRPTLQFGLGTSVCSTDNKKCEDGVKARAASFSWQLTKAEMTELNSLTSPNDNPTLFASAGCPDSFVLPKTKKP